MKNTALLIPRIARVIYYKNTYYQIYVLPVLCIIKITHYSDLRITRITHYRNYALSQPPVSPPLPIIKITTDAALIVHTASVFFIIITRGNRAACISRDVVSRRVISSVCEYVRQYRINQEE